MKHLTLISALLLSFTSVLLAQPPGVDTYSYSEFFARIAAEPDTVFRLADAYIVYDPETDARFAYSDTEDDVDRDTLLIDKALQLSNVHFLHLRSTGVNMLSEVAIREVRFRKPVELEDTYSGVFKGCVFEDDFSLRSTDRIDTILVARGQAGLPFSALLWEDCRFWKRTSVAIRKSEQTPNVAGPRVLFFRNDFRLDLAYGPIQRPLNISLVNSGIIQFEGNDFSAAKAFPFGFWSVGNSTLRISGNDFGLTRPTFFLTNLDQTSRLYIGGNRFGEALWLTLRPALQANHTLAWQQFAGKLLSAHSYFEYERAFTDSLGLPLQAIRSDSFGLRAFAEKLHARFRVENRELFVNELALREQLRRHYQAQHDTESANGVFVEIKELETERLAFQHARDPSSGTFFRLQLNRMLGKISKYGTEPELVLRYSFRIILIFAFVYLFFPNSWDTHGWNRMLDRFRFFITYLNSKAGMQDLYLQEIQPRQQAYEDFKTYLATHQEAVPGVIARSGRWLYRWSVSAQRLYARVLRKTDVLKGKWTDIPPKRRRWKSVLIVTVFLFALLWDLLIKMLNALMLSINTFTTLGFGEIPIRGLPRYLAIIQGFIGWFMLTIFSVSLISQLLG